MSIQFEIPLLSWKDNLFLGGLSICAWKLSGVLVGRLESYFEEDPEEKVNQPFLEGEEEKEYLWEQSEESPMRGCDVLVHLIAPGRLQWNRHSKTDSAYQGEDPHHTHNYDDYRPLVYSVADALYQQW